MLHPARSPKNRYALAGLLLAAPACTASIVPPTIAPGTPSAAAERRGRALLLKTAKLHGLERYRAARTLGFRMEDHWQGLLGRIANPWPDNPASMDWVVGLRSFDARVTFSAGDQKGTTWGLQNWKSYTRSSESETKFEADGDISFILPAIQYLTEFPFRALEAERVAHAGETVMVGVTYDLVLVTWKSYEARTDVDQYVAYINRETGRLEKVHYTVRDFARFARGTCHYREFVDAGGILVPTIQTVTAEPDHDLRDYLHEIRIDRDSIEVDPVPRVALLVDPSQGEGRDAKP